MSNFSEKYRSFMARRNGPDQLARDALVVALIFIVISVFCANTVRAVLLAIGIAFMVYSYWRLFSTKVADRSRENSAYLAKRNQLLGKVRQPLERAGKKGQQAATRAKDKDHRYFACPKCGQTVRVPKGAGKIRVTCPKCGEKFEKKA